MNNYLFGYGSLINPNSISRTLGKQINQNDLKVVFLKGYRRIWNLVDQIMIHEYTSPTNAVFLNIEKHQDCNVNGVIFKLTNDELKNFDNRERNYNRIDVTKITYPQTKECKVYTYVGKLECLSNNYLKKYKMKKYEKIIDEGLSFWGEPFITEFIQQTKPQDIESLDGSYQFLKH